MARPLKQTVDYFPHSTNHGKTMFIIEQRYGNDGYAFWFKLLEILASTVGHYLDLNDENNWEFLQAKTHLSNGSCDEMLNLLAKLGAIDSELWCSRVVWSANFVQRLGPLYQNRRVETPLRPSFYNQKPHSEEVSTTEKPQSKVKESKVKESKVKESKVKESKVKESKGNKTKEEEITYAFDENIQKSSWYESFQGQYPQFKQTDFEAAVEWVIVYNQTHPKKPRQVTKAFLINWAKRNQETGGNHGSNRRNPRPGAPGYQYTDPD